jgi:hypothetical protein
MKTQSEIEKESKRGIVEIKEVQLDEIHPAKKNPRKITTTMKRKLDEAISKFGMVNPVIVNSDMTIIGGHQRYDSCKRLGIQKILVVILDLSKKDEQTLNLALNKIGGSFDADMLRESLMELTPLEIELAGFSGVELDKFSKEKEENIPYPIAYRLFEKHDYIVLFFHNELDFQAGCAHFGIEKQNMEGRNNVGLGKVVDGAEYLKSIDKILGRKK